MRGRGYAQQPRSKRNGPRETRGPGRKILLYGGTGRRCVVGRRAAQLPVDGVLFCSKSRAVFSTPSAILLESIVSVPFLIA